MAQPSKEFISSIRLAESIEQERFLLSTEQAKIRAAIKKDPNLNRPRIVTKLIFLDILGQNVSWGQLEAINLMTHERFSYKRIGYIGAHVLLDETTDLTVLVTQTLLKDLQSTDPHIQALALTFIANCASNEVARAVAAPVQRLLDSTNPQILKRAGMALIKVVQTNPDLVENFRNSVQKLLNNSSHGVINAGINMVVEMIGIHPKLAKTWHQFSAPFTRILKTLNRSKGSKEFNYSGFADPFMQVKTLKALEMLKQGSDELDGLLQSIISSTIARRSAGRAVLYQAVETVVAVSSSASLRGLAFNQVGRLLSMKDPNVLYSALSVFARVLYADIRTTGKRSVDSIALQRYKGPIVRCLEHRDPSIRRRALDVISALIDETNAETLVPEILGFVKLADSEFRMELITKVYTASVKFSPSDTWLFDIVHEMFVTSGNYVSQEIFTGFCERIAESVELQRHAVVKLGQTIEQFADNQPLVQFSAYLLGEYGGNETAPVFQRILTLPQTEETTKLYIIMALAKMAVKSGEKEETLQALSELAKSQSLEVQQRAGEMITLIQRQQAGEKCLFSYSEMAPQDEIRETVTKPEIGDLLLELANDNVDQINDPQPRMSPLDDLLDSIPIEPTPSPPQPQTQPQAQIQPQLIELAETNDFKLYAQVQKNVANPRQYAVQFTALSKATMQLGNFKMEYSVPSAWQIQVQQQSSSILAPEGGQPVKQVVYLLDQGLMPFSMKIRVTYLYGAQPATEIITVNNLISK